MLELTLDNRCGNPALNVLLNIRNDFFVLPRGRVIDGDFVRELDIVDGNELKGVIALECAFVSDIIAMVDADSDYGLFHLPCQPNLVEHNLAF